MFKQCGLVPKIVYIKICLRSCCRCLFRSPSPSYFENSTQLLTRDPLKRLGCGIGDASEIKVGLSGLVLAMPCSLLTVWRFQSSPQISRICDTVALLFFFHRAIHSFEPLTGRLCCNVSCGHHGFQLLHPVLTPLNSTTSLPVCPLSVLRYIIMFSLFLRSFSYNFSCSFLSYFIFWCCELNDRKDRSAPDGSHIVPVRFEGFTFVAQKALDVSCTGRKLVQS
jgi:hypothetical protein